MKFLIVAAFAFMAVVSVQAITDEQKAKLQELCKKCVAETKVDESLILKARKKEFTDDPKLKEYYVCMFKSLKFVDDAGKLNVDLIVKLLPVEKKEGLSNIVKDCAGGAEGKGALPEIVYTAFKCFVEKCDEEIQFN